MLKDRPYPSFTGTEYNTVVIGTTQKKSEFTIRFIQYKNGPSEEDVYQTQMIVNEETCSLKILDTAGQEEYSAMRDGYMRSGESFIFVCELTSNTNVQSELDELSALKEQILRVKDVDTVPMVIVCIIGHKELDQYYGRKTKEEREQDKTLIRKTFDCPLFEIDLSYATEIEIANPFYQIISCIRQHYYDCARQAISKQKISKWSRFFSSKKKEARKFPQFFSPVTTVSSSSSDEEPSTSKVTKPIASPQAEKKVSEEGRARQTQIEVDKQAKETQKNTETKERNRDNLSSATMPPLPKIQSADINQLQARVNLLLEQTQLPLYDFVAINNRIRQQENQVQELQLTHGNLVEVQQIQTLLAKEQIEYNKHLRLTYLSEQGLYSYVREFQLQLNSGYTSCLAVYGGEVDPAKNIQDIGISGLGMLLAFIPGSQIATGFLHALSDKQKLNTVIAPMARLCTGNIEMGKVAENLAIELALRAPPSLRQQASQQAVKALDQAFNKMATWCKEKKLRWKERLSDKLDEQLALFDALKVQEAILADKISPEGCAPDNVIQAMTQQSLVCLLGRDVETHYPLPDLSAFQQTLLSSQSASTIVLTQGSAAISTKQTPQMLPTQEAYGERQTKMMAELKVANQLLKTQLDSLSKKMDKRDSDDVHISETLNKLVEQSQKLENKIQQHDKTIAQIKPRLSPDNAANKLGLDREHGMQVQVSGKDFTEGNEKARIFMANLAETQEQMNALILVFLAMQEKVERHDKLVESPEVAKLAKGW